MYKMKKIIVFSLILSLFLVTGCMNKEIEDNSVEKEDTNKSEIVKETESDNKNVEDDKIKEDKEDYRKIKLDEFKKALSSLKYKELPGDIGIIYEEVEKEAYISATIGNTDKGGFIRSKVIGAYKLPDTETEFKEDDKIIKSIYNLFGTISKSSIKSMSYEYFLNTINDSIKNESLDEYDLETNIFPAQNDNQFNQHITIKDNILQFIIVEDENRNLNKYEYKAINESGLNEEIKSWNDKLNLGLNEVASKMNRNLNVVNSDVYYDDTDFNMGDDIHISNIVESRKPVLLETNGTRFGNSRLTIQSEGSDYKEKLHYILDSVIPVYNEIFGLSINIDELKSYVECEEIYRDFFDNGGYLLQDIEYFDIEPLLGEPWIEKAIDNFSKYSSDKMASPSITVDTGYNNKNWIRVEIEIPFLINEDKESE